MTNKEHYKNEILDLACEGEVMALDISTKELVPCTSIDCQSCCFSAYNREDASGSCNDERKHWLEQEYKTPHMVLQYSLDIFTVSGKVDMNAVKSALRKLGYRVLNNQFRDNLTDEYQAMTQEQFKQLLKQS